MSEQRASYRTPSDTLLQPDINSANMEPTQMPAPPDPAHLERMLIPLLNWARRAQGKKPVVLPKG